jgi:hypothetical protein
MKKLPILFIFCLICGYTLAQKSKEAKELNLKTKTMWVTEKKGKKEFNYKASELRFDKDGSLIQEIEYNSKGDIVKNVSYQYENNKKVREIYLSKDGTISSRIEYIYSKNNILSEIRYFNSNNDLKRKEQFIYEQQD